MAALLEAIWLVGDRVTAERGCYLMEACRLCRCNSTSDGASTTHLAVSHARPITRPGPGRCFQAMWASTDITKAV
ncbi:hypothetical protein B0T09DRAFT_332180, partial [Sordaria sp. MPI-SDFR-AT-0083]